jgi:solute carrier family 45 protein 1/2/4
MHFFDAGEIFGGHVRAVFTLITFIFIICVAFTVTSFREVPLTLLEGQAQVGEGPHTVLLADTC